MSTNVIQADYATLESIAARFGQQLEVNSALFSQVQRGFLALSQEGWEGRGSTEFAAEMQGEIFPALQRLNHALGEAQAVTLQIKDVLQQAEEEAAQPFGGDGDGAASDGSGGEGGIGWGTVAGIAAGGLIGGAIGAVAGGTIGTVGVDGVISGIAGAISAVGGIVGAVTNSGIYSAISDAVEAGGVTLDQLSDLGGLADTEIGSVIKGADKVFKIAGYVTDVIELTDTIINAETPREAFTGVIGFAGGKIGAWGGASAGSAFGVVVGGAIGSVFPGLGTVIGAGIGKVVGGVIGHYIGKDIGKDVFEPIGGVLYDIGEATVAEIGEISGHVGNFIDDTVDGLGDVVNGVGDFVSDPLGWL